MATGSHWTDPANAIRNKTMRWHFHWMPIFSLQHVGALHLIWNRNFGMDNSDRSENLVHYMVWRCGWIPAVLCWFTVLTPCVHRASSIFSALAHAAFCFSNENCTVTNKYNGVRSHEWCFYVKVSRPAVEDVCARARAPACTHRMSPFDVLIDVKNILQSSHRLQLT